MTISEDTSLTDLAFLVCDALHKSGLTAVLTGGSAATVYAPESYQSRDLDFILDFWSSFDNSEAPLLALGFRRDGTLYKHPDTHLTVDFPAGPLAIWNDEITEWDTLERDGMKLNILSPTDSVRDRLAWFLQRQTDFSALEQALAVAANQSVDLEAIEAWCLKEGQANKFEIFKYRLEQMKSELNG